MKEKNHTRALTNEKQQQKKMMKERFKKLRPPFPLAHRPDLGGIIAVGRSAH